MLEFGAANTDNSSGYASTAVGIPLVYREQARRVLGYFATGVTIVTSCYRNDVGGMTVNAFLSLSLDPPLIGVCLSHNSHTHSLVKKAGIYAISILRSDHVEVARAFAQPHTEKGSLFTTLRWRTHLTGAPTLADALGVLDCRVVQEWPVADHTLFIAEPLMVAVDESRSPLLFFSGRFQSLTGAS